MRDMVRKVSLLSNMSHTGTESPPSRGGRRAKRGVSRLAVPHINVTIQHALLHPLLKSLRFSNHFKSGFVKGSVVQKIEQRSGTIPWDAQ